MKTPPTPITPTDQKNTLLAGREVIAVRLPDNHTAGAFRMLCKMLSLDYVRQLQKVQTHPVISASLIMAYIETSKGIRAAYVIMAEAIPIWLTEIHPTKVAPEACELLEECQRSVAETIRRVFFPYGKDAPTSTPPPREPESAPLLGTSFKEVVGPFAERLTQELEALKQAQDKTNRIVAMHTEQIKGLLEANGRLVASTGLSLEHQGALRVMLHALSHQTHQPISAIEYNLLMAVGVLSIGELPEAKWGEVAAWFHTRLGWGGSL